MQIIEGIIQGSPEWHAYRAKHFNASDAPAMLDCSPYKARSQLLQEYATGITQEIDKVTQRRFDDGHRFEALARPIVEKIIGQDLYPVVGSEGKYSASFDGLTADDSTGFEHKSLNDKLRSVMVEGCTGADLPKMYRVQMEQQCMVSGANRILFMASKWNGDQLEEERHCWYTPDLALRAEIIASWAQFEKDLAEYVPPEITPAAVAAPQPALPAVFVQVSGGVSVRDNLTAFGDALKTYVERINKKPETDEDFATLEATVKTLKTAEEALDAAEAGALAQTESIDLMRRMVAEYRELARSNRLVAEKVVKAEKENRRNAIVQKGKDAFVAHIAALNARLGKPYMPQVLVDFAGSVKGLKTMSSIQNAVDTELARAKIEANAIADKIDANLRSLRETAKDHAFLFSDTSAIVMKENDDLVALIKSRIADHAAVEAAKAEALRAKIAEEERIKVEAQIRAEREAEERRIAEIHATKEAEATKAQPVAVAVTYPPLTAERAGLPVHNVVQITPSTTPTLRLGQINERIAPLSISADGLRALGFEPAARDKSAMLYHEQDFSRICTALVNHIYQVQQRPAA